MYNYYEHVPYYARRVLVSSAVVAICGVSLDYLWFLSLPRTNVPANTAIYQSSLLFTFLLSVPILRERVTVLKVRDTIIPSITFTS